MLNPDTRTLELNYKEAFIIGKIIEGERELLALLQKIGYSLSNEV